MDKTRIIVAAALACACAFAWADGKTTYRDAQGRIQGTKK